MYSSPLMARNPRKQLYDQWASWFFLRHEQGKGFTHQIARFVEEEFMKSLVGIINETDMEAFETQSQKSMFPLIRLIVECKHPQSNELIHASAHQVQKAWLRLFRRRNSALIRASCENKITCCIKRDSAKTVNELIFIFQGDWRMEWILLEVRRCEARAFMKIHYIYIGLRMIRCATNCVIPIFQRFPFD